MMSSGAARAIVAAFFSAPSTASAPRTKPSVSAPVSPMKIVAGW